MRIKFIQKLLKSMPEKEALKALKSTFPSSLELEYFREYARTLPERQRRKLQRVERELRKTPSRLLGALDTLILRDAMKFTVQE